MAQGEKLLDYIRDGLRAVICGTAAGLVSAKRKHYYAGPGNRFWEYLDESGLTAGRLWPEQDHRVVEYGIGLTDLAKRVAASSDRGLGGEYDIEGFAAKIDKYKPMWVAFHGKTAAREFCKAVAAARFEGLGEQSWSIGSSRVFVLPSSSASNQNPAGWDGRASRLEWFKELSEKIEGQK